MIYLENNNGTQQIFIPKNLNISISKTYDEGFQDGIDYQKNRLTVLNVTENGVYKSENGYKQVNVEVPIYSEPCNLGELEYNVDSDYYVINALQQGYDGFNVVKIDATEYGQNKFDEGYSEGINAGGSSSCNLKPLKASIEDNGLLSRFAVLDDADGYSNVDIDAIEYGNKRYNEGYSEGVNAGGGTSCNIGRLEEEISVNSIGHIFRYASDYGVDGWNYLDLDVNGYGNEKYQEGYNQGKSECGEGGSCNIGVIYELGYVNEDGFVLRNSADYGLDGWSEISFDVNDYGQEKYNEGYEQGKSEGCELTELNVTKNGTYEGAFNKVNVAVVSSDVSAQKVEDTYSINAIEIMCTAYASLNDDYPLFVKNNITDMYDGYIPNDFICLSDYNAKTGSIWCKQREYNNHYAIYTIKQGALNTNNIERIRFNIPVNLKENSMNNGSNIRRAYFSYDGTDNVSILENDAFRSNSLLNRIYFEGKIIINGNPFYDIPSEGTLYGLHQYYNEYYAPIMSLLGSGWTFEGCSSKEELLDKYNY